MKVLHMTSSLDGGGIARLLYDYYIKMDDEIQFDFAITSQTKGIMEAPLESLGCNIFHIPQIRKDFSGYKKCLKKIIEQGAYDIVHTHSDYRSFFDLYYAKKYGIKNRIVHSHLAYSSENVRDNFEKIVFTPLMKSFATNYFACSKDAALWSFGKQSYDDVFIMKNAIDINAFEFSSLDRIKYRKELDIESNFVIGCVARLCFQKNQSMLLDIFKIVLEKKENAILILAGSGEMESELKSKAKAIGVSENVIFLGVRDDVSKLINAFDTFVLPSRYEGLGIAYVEAQANGLSCFATDGRVPKEVKICNNFTFIDSDDPQIWAKHIISQDHSRIEEATKLVCESGYDIDAAARKLNQYYLDMGK